MNGKPDQTKVDTLKREWSLPRPNWNWVTWILILLCTFWLTFRIDGQRDLGVKQVKEQFKEQLAQGVKVLTPPQRGR